VLIFRCGGLVRALNTGKHPVALPAGELALSSAPLAAGKLMPNAAAWLA
jgi:alpha-glucosidase